MAIKKFFSNKAKAGWRWDEKQKKFSSWGFDIWLENGKRKRESGFGTRNLAEMAVARIRLDEKEGKYELKQIASPMLEKVLEKRLEMINDRQEKVRATRVFQMWLGLLPLNIKIGELKASHLRTFIDVRIQQVSPASTNREVTCIASALHSAHLNFPELENWRCFAIPRPKVEKSRRERLISQDETMKLLTTLFEPRREKESKAEFSNRRKVGQVFKFLLLTGARIGEINSLRWEQIDFKEKLIQIIGTKTRYKSAKTVRYLELSESLAEILCERKELSNGEFVFSRTGNSITHYYKIMKEACERLGIKYGKYTNGGFVSHDARHTGITRMLQSGVDLATIGAITGHSDHHLILHYSHATRESRKAATSILENFFGAAERINVGK